MSAMETPRPDAFAAAAAALNGQPPIRRARLRHLASRLQAADPERVVQEIQAYSTDHPDDTDALVVLADIAAARGRPNEAVKLFARAVDAAPGRDAVRFAYAELLFSRNQFSGALAQANNLLERDSCNPIFRQLKAKVLDSLGCAAEALAIVEQLARENPHRAECWMTYGHALRAAGRGDEAIAAYRRAIELRPTLGLAYANLANLKTFRFSDTELAAMDQLMKSRDLVPEDRTNLQFALGKAYEQRGAYADAFEHYAKGNAASRLRFPYDPEAMSQGVRRTCGFFTQEFFESRRGMGCAATDPIFIVGRPRSGSTLIEQILASHSAIEATGELPYIPDIIAEIADVEGSGGGHYFGNLEQLTPEALMDWGEKYLASAAQHRRGGRPFFTDKNPGNVFHLGLIALVLPNAKIVDVRRNPAAVCWSEFTHQFAAGNLRLTELAQAWRDYAEVIAHFDSVLPGKIYRVVYENLVSDTATEIQGLLAHLNLPFEESCLRFYETKRAVLTPSSEQVRRPITAEPVNHWRRFEPWLGPMLKSLGDALTCYPAAPPRRYVNI